MLVALVMPILAACGDDDDDADPTEDTAGTTATSAPSGQTPAGTTPTTAAAESPTSDAAASPTEDSAAGSPTTAGSPDTATGRVELGSLDMGQTIEDAESEGGTVIEGTFADIASLMPVVSDDSATFDFQSGIFEPLVDTNPFTLEPAAALAVAYESNEDASVWTLYLREGVTWHDGEPFTANDVKFTFDLHMNAETGSSYTADLTAKIESVEVVDDLTVQFNLTGTLADFLLDMGGYGIVAEHIWADIAPADIKTDGGATGADPSRVVGTGPMMFVEWIPGDHATSARYEGYWDGDAHIDEFIYKVVPDQSAGVAQLQTGELDIFQGIPGSQVAEFDGNQDVNVVAADRLGFTFYGLNMDPEKTTLFQDAEVRQALMYAIDRQALVDEIRFGFGQVAVGTMPPLSWAFNPDGIELTYPYDPEQAVALLEQAGWTDTNGNGVVDKDGQELSFSMYTNAGNLEREAYLTALQEYWREIGVEMTPQLEDFAALVDRITETHDFEGALLGFSWDATPDQSAMWHCDSYEGGFNMVRYCNEEVDTLLEQALDETDRDKRVELYTEMQNILMEDMPMAIIDFPQLPIGITSSAHNMFASDINFYWNMEDWWIEQ
jgi:peptide/nickel transport system substrate-binding protein